MRKYQLSSWVIFRHILAVIHFNYNLRREPIVNKSDKSETQDHLSLKMARLQLGMSELHRTLVSVCFTYTNQFCKFNFLIINKIFFAAYIQEIYETILSSSEKDLKEAAVKLKEICPPSMNTMLSKQTKSDALKKRSDRRQIIIKDVPPSTPGTRSLYVAFFLLFSIK